MAEDKMHYDAIVVGSGISGGWAAKELTEKGLKVRMKERMNSPIKIFCLYSYFLLSHLLCYDAQLSQLSTPLNW